MVNIGNDWDRILEGEFEKEYYLKLREFLKKEYASRVIYPSMYDIFNALKTTPYENVKVVILGQDPYHGPGQAHGMCFSVREGIAPPPSLRNIFKELAEDMNCTIPPHGCLTQGGSGGSSSEHGAHRTGGAGEFSQRKRLGNLYRYGDPSSQSERKADGIFALGRKRKGESFAYHQSGASRPDCSSSQSAVRIQWLFRMRSFFESK